MDTILLFKKDGMWCAKHIGPHSHEIVKLFGTDTVATAFTSQIEGETVRNKIKDLNPNKLVLFSND